MADHDGAILQRQERLLEGWFPCRIARSMFIWHSRIADFEIRAQLLAQTRHQLVVPFIVGALAGSLNEKQLTFHLHVPYSSPGRSRAHQCQSLSDRRKLISTDEPFFPKSFREQSSDGGNQRAAARHEHSSDLSRGYSRDLQCTFGGL